MSRLDSAPTRDAPERWQPSELLVPRFFVALLACVAAMGVAGLADAAGEHDGLSRLDPVIASGVLTWRTSLFTLLAQVLTFLGSEVVVGGLAIAVFAFLVARRQLTRATLFAIGMAGSAFLTVAVKLLVA